MKKNEKNTAMGEKLNAIISVGIFMVSDLS